MATRDHLPVDLGQFPLQLGPNLPRFSDKAIFPPSVLSLIIGHHENDLPHPLIFRLLTSSSSCHVGVKEFSSPDEVVILPESIIDKLLVGQESVDTISIRLETAIPKATFLTLKPLQFYPEITNWKYYLESKLPSLYTTLTKNEHLVIEGEHQYELLIEDCNAATVCIIDTDIVLDVIPLNDIMANQQLEFDKNLNYLNNIEEIDHELEVYDLSPIGKSMTPRLFKIDITKFKQQFITIELLMDASEFIKNDYSTLFNVDLVAGLDKLINLENFQYTTIDDDFTIQKNLNNGGSNRFKSIVIDLKDDSIVNKLHKGQEETDDEGKNPERFIYLIPFTWESASSITIRVIDGVKPTESYVESIEEGLVKCKNCLKSISKLKLPLHEAFCYRNNKLCSCGQVFLREIPSNHWHCGPCDNDSLMNGNLTLLKFKHDKLHHLDSYQCDKCQTTNYSNFLDLVLNHKGKDCPMKLHECKFCHLILPQEETTFEDKFVNLTHHENTCGNKTTECYKCNKLLRTKDLNKHLKLHDLDKQQFNEINQLTFNKCSNLNCINQVDTRDTNELGLCVICYGPLYIPQHDPTNIKLQSRLERKYMIQLSKGCGSSWCQNQECLTGNKSIPKRSIKELLKHINEELFPQISHPALPINKNKSTGPNQLWFCVNQSVSDKKHLVDKLVFEQQYNTAIIYKAVNQVGSDEDAVRAWLLENGAQ